MPVGIEPQLDTPGLSIPAITRYIRQKHPPVNKTFWTGLKIPGSLPCVVPFGEMPSSELPLFPSLPSCRSSPSTVLKPPSPTHIPGLEHPCYFPWVHGVMGTLPLQKEFGKWLLFLLPLLMLGMEARGEALPQSYVYKAKPALGSGDPCICSEERAGAPGLNHQKIKHMSPFTQARN